MKYGIYCLLFSTLLHGMAQDAKSSNSGRHDLYEKVCAWLDRTRRENAGKPQSPFIFSFERCTKFSLTTDDIQKLANELAEIKDIETTNNSAFEDRVRTTFKQALNEVATRGWDKQLTPADEELLNQVRRIIAMIPITHSTRERPNAHWENYNGARYLITCLKNVEGKDPDVDRQEFEAMAARLAQRKASKPT